MDFRIVHLLLTIRQCTAGNGCQLGNFSAFKVETNQRILSLLSMNSSQDMVHGLTHCKQLLGD